MTLVRIIESEMSCPPDQADISEAKGMVNRVARRDQPDWRAVHEVLWQPERSVCRLYARWFEQLRDAARGRAAIDELLREPVTRGILTMMRQAAYALSQIEKIEGMPRQH
jgi:hypothetical protein